ncbi:MAG: DUF255 domain-containing protein, partial [Cyclobacteriaceae bacterium]
MKRLILILFPLTLLAQEGIDFQGLSWDQTLAKAKKEQKLIFMDAYTTWCQPCKTLEKYTFSDPSVGALYNASFINVRFDMEQYPGLELAEKYNVDLYPTLLFINGDGELVHRGCGAMEVPDFLDLGKTALSPDQNLLALGKKYEAGERSTGFVDDYISALGEACQDVDKFLANFFKEVPSEELIKQDNWDVIRDYVFDVYGREFLYVLKNQEAFSEAHGQDEVQDKIFDTFMITYSELSESDVSLFAIKSLRYLASSHEFERQQEVVDYLNFGLGEITEDWELYADGAMGFVELGVEDPEFIMDIAWKFYLFVDDNTKLLAALNWTKYVLENNEPQPAAIDTYAS